MSAPPATSIEQEVELAASAVNAVGDIPSSASNAEDTQAQLVDRVTLPKSKARQKRRPRRGSQSAFNIAVAIFFSLNVLGSYSQPIAFDMYRYIYRGWAWWTFHDLREHPETHNVAILGSSLTVSATNGCDSTYLNKGLDLTQYHRATYFDEQLQKKFGGKFNTYNLSAPGQMPSDAYFTLRAMVATAERPDVVIYGVAPRDFIDSQLSSPVDTEPFHYLTRLVGTDGVAEKLFRNPTQKFDSWLQKVCYSYGNCLNYQMVIGDVATAAINKILPCPKTNHPFTYWDRTKLLPKYMAGEIKEGAMICQPMSDPAQVDFKDNTREYVERYRHPDPHIYKTQFYFLKELAKFCRREKIELVLVNMPLTRYNVSLLKPFWYLNYSQALREFGFYNNLVVFDLNDFNRYSQADYHDSVHLNGFGGMKFFDSLVGEAAGNARTNAALELAGKELEREQQVASTNRPIKVE